MVKLLPLSCQEAENNDKGDRYESLDDLIQYHVVTFCRS